jgi:NAD+ synthase (glutamine-hydrolysing)
VKLALAQINPTVGDFEGNKGKILEFARHAAALQADLVLFPELCVCGYPPADLLEKDSFILRAGETVREIAKDAPDIPLIVGYVTPSPRKTGKRVMNSAALLENGAVKFVQSKMLLPYYDVFDEQRYFAAAQKQELTPFSNENLALTICEDAWNDKDFWPRPLYDVDPVELLVAAGGTMVLNISASPFYRGKPALRREMLATLARSHGTIVAMVNQVGGNDSLVFDGNSLVLGPDGEVLGQAAAFEEDLLMVDTAKAARSMAIAAKIIGSDPSGRRFALTDPAMPPALQKESDRDLDDVHHALVLGTRDYVRKCGFERAIVGLSGGIDSALVAAVAVEALGKENVLGVLMPSEYSSPGSVTDAQKLAQNLGITVEKIPIANMFHAFESSLAPAFAGLRQDITEENMQSRIRGALLMALSNKRGALVLTTGNKSEMAVGYSTLYGDMVGALAVIGDVYKTEVYRLSRRLNREREIIPLATIVKPPSAELRPGQKDTDSLPPYDVLDPILEAYIERYESPETIAQATGAALELVRSIVKLVERSEYKRQQAAPVLKVSYKSFGLGRRFPIAVKVQV